jgi:hypothetical protein
MAQYQSFCGRNSAPLAFSASAAVISILALGVSGTQAASTAARAPQVKPNLLLDAEQMTKRAREADVELVDLRHCAANAGGCALLTAKQPNERIAPDRPDRLPACEVNRVAFDHERMRRFERNSGIWRREIETLAVHDLSGKKLKSWQCR